jgi:hypothetical protein
MKERFTMALVSRREPPFQPLLNQRLDGPTRARSLLRKPVIEIRLQLKDQCGHEHLTWVRIEPLLILIVLYNATVRAAR